jgi:hypothetical protein
VTIRLKAFRFAATIGAICSCSSDSTAPPQDPPLLGTYVLESVDGQTLPWLALDEPFLRLYFLADTMRILSQSSAEGISVARRHFEGDPVGVVSTHRTSGTFRRVAPNTIVFDNSIPGDTVFVTAHGLRERSPPFQACTANPCIWIWRRL